MSAVLAFRPDLLAARLGNMMYAWEFARAVGRPLIVYWPQSEFVFDNYDFFSIFDEIRLSKELPEIIVISENLFPELNRILGTNFESWNDIPLADVDLVSETPPALQSKLVYYRSPRPIWKTKPMLRVTKAQIPELFNQLPLRPLFQELVQQALEMHVADSVGVHMRRGDFIDFKPINKEKLRDSGVFTAKTVPDEHLCNVFISKYVPTSTFLRLTEGEPHVTLFSDVVADKNVLQAVLGPRAIDVYPLLDRFEMTSLQRAFCDLLIMSRTRRIIAPISNFSLWAAIIGGRELTRADKMTTALEVLDDVEKFMRISPLNAEDKSAFRRTLFGRYQEYYRIWGRSEDAAICERVVALTG